MPSAFEFRIEPDVRDFHGIFERNESGRHYQDVCVVVLFYQFPDFSAPGQSRTDFLIAAALGKEITLMEDLKPILYELRRIGNNVNQLTKLANMGSIKTVNLEEFTEMLGQLHVALMQIALSGKENHRAGSDADQV